MFSKKNLAKITHHLLGLLIGSVLYLWHLTCRYQTFNDTRHPLKQQKIPYILALLHAHQIAAIFASDEPQIHIMVSRSLDAELLIPFTRLRKMIPVRGSSRSGHQQRSKGGYTALKTLIRAAKKQIPTCIAVDGPKGPRGKVKEGIIELALSAKAAIIPMIAIAQPHFKLKQTWDKMCIPYPFSKIKLIFGEPLLLPNQANIHLDQEERAKLKRQLELALKDLEYHSSQD